MSARMTLSPTTNSWSAQLKVGPTEKKQWQGLVSLVGSNNLRYTLKAPPPSAVSFLPVHCQVGEWSDWSPCARAGRPCWIKRNQTRTRQILQYPSLLGNPCPEMSEARECPVKRRKCQGKDTNLQHICLCEKRKRFLLSRRYPLAVTVDPR